MAPLKTKKNKKATPRRSGSAQAQRRQKVAPGAERIKSAEFNQYGLFLALGHEERKAIFGFSTDQQFAKKFSVHPSTLSHWKLEEELWTIRDRYLIVYKKHTGPIIAALAKRAVRTGEAFHSLSFLKVVEGFTEKTGLDITSKGKRVGGFKVVVRHAAHSPTTSRNKAGR